MHNFSYLTSQSHTKIWVTAIIRDQNEIWYLLLKFWGSQIYIWFWLHHANQTKKLTSKIRWRLPGLINEDSWFITPCSSSDLKQREREREREREERDWPRRPEGERTPFIPVNSQNVYFVSMGQEASIYSSLGEGASPLYSKVIGQATHYSKAYTHRET